MTTATLKTLFDRSPRLRNLGALAFVFFFVKGLLWLAAPLVFYYLT